MYPIEGQVCPYGIITTNRKSPVYQGVQVYGKVFHPFPNRKIEPRSSYIVGGYSNDKNKGVGKQDTAGGAENLKNA